MRTFQDAKAMAKSLRTALSQRQVALSHSECLEIVAAQFAVENWNILSAKIDATPGATENQSTMTSDPQLREAIPILRIFSVEKAKEFYLDFLGFTLDWEHRFGDNFPLYAQVSRKRRLRPISKDVKGRIATRWCNALQSVDDRVANR